MSGWHLPRRLAPALAVLLVGAGAGTAQVRANARVPAVHLVGRATTSPAAPPVSWETTIAVQDAAAAARALRTREVPFVSPGPVTLEARPLGFGTALLIPDPDGHALEVIQP